MPRFTAGVWFAVQALVAIVHGLLDLRSPDEGSL
jgi:hypothetical protein